MKIGEVYFNYDCNHRVYEDPVTKQRYAGPIYRLSFVKWYVIGETKKSYLLSRFKDSKPDNKMVEKMPKRIDPVIHGYLTEEQMEDSVFMYDNQYRVSQEVGKIREVSKLKKIIAILEEK